MSKFEQNLMNTSKPATFIRVSMEPLYERLIKKPFPDSVSAIEYCRSVCAEFGFTVKQEASANRNIYVYCSREGLPDSQRNPKPSPQRKRPSKRCDCRWRVVLSENENEQWEFRKSMNPSASEHNHEMMSPDEMVKAWPVEVNEMIIELARQRLQTHEIREAVKQHFPDITWNERRFYNRLTEERKRIRQRGVVERSQRLLLLSARLCSLVANNEEWTNSVENELQHNFENFCQLARVPFESANSLVDIEPELIQIETDRLVSNTHHLSIRGEDEGAPLKKRRSIVGKGNNAESQKGVQMVYVPSYTIQVWSRPPNELRNTESSFLDTQQRQLFSLASPSSSSTSSSFPFQHMQTPKNSHNDFITYSQDHDFNQLYPFVTIHDRATTTPFFPIIKEEPIQDYHSSMLQQKNNIGLR